MTSSNNTEGLSTQLRIDFSESSHILNSLSFEKSAVLVDLAVDAVADLVADLDVDSTAGIGVILAT
ncbi:MULTISPECIES: hypothetical protein [unclassified Shewanella]|uniref:hypothetical protein n=1 Tax=unclassified Shewanella TaxID=196818 RepID=UPI0035517E81